MSTLLEARQVTKVFSSGGLIGKKRAVTVALEDASLAILDAPPAIISIAGESGSGKTTLSRLLLGLIRPTKGDIFFEGKALRDMSRDERMDYRRRVQAIFQDPFEVYNPFYTVDHALMMPLDAFEPGMSKADKRATVERALEQVGLRSDETLGRYPHQLSGGQRQRVMVARTLMLNPSIIVADEPVSMVDASLRATILETLLKAHHDLGASLMYITHDLTTAYQVSQTIVMLYQGSIVEVGTVDLVIREPKHPYTRLLVSSIPLPDPRRRWGEGVEEATEGQAVDGRGRKGCKFAVRCPHVMDMCWDAPPPLYAADGGRAAACYLYRDAPALTAEDVKALYSPR